MVTIPELAGEFLRLVFNPWAIGSSLIVLALARELGIGERRLAHAWILDIIIIVLLVILAVIVFSGR